MTVTRFTLGEYGRALGHAVWLERRGFELSGGWARDTPEPAAAIAFAAVSAHHGWRTRLLEPLLPSTRDHDPDALVGPATPEWRDRLDELAPAGSTPARLVAGRALLDAIRESHEALLGQLTTVADATAVRVLTLIVADHAADRTVLDRI